MTRVLDAKERGWRRSVRIIAVKVELNRDVCTGHGRCYVLAPEVFEADDDGYGVVRVAEVTPELEAAARKGAGNCPENAITVLDD